MTNQSPAGGRPQSDADQTQLTYGRPPRLGLPRPTINPSNRPSDRVDQRPATTPVPAGISLLTGHESMTPPVTRASSPEGQPTRRGRHQLEDVRRSLSARDWFVLNQLARFRYLTTAHLQQLCFADHATAQAAGRACRRVLARLARNRVIEHLDRRIGGFRAGSQSYVWRVGVIGDRLLRLQADAPRDRRHEPGLRFLDHVLAVADCAVTLTLAGPSDGVQLEHLMTEPDSWRRYTSRHGSLETLKPDLYARTVSGDFEDHWFIEIDRGTESLPVVVRQCERYEAYRATGRAQADLGVFPLVVWLTPDDARAGRIRAAIARTTRLDQALYRAAPQAQLLALMTGQGAS